MVDHTVICTAGKDPYQTTWNVLQHLEVNNVVHTGDRVVIKPNLCSNKLASTGITTHPEVVEAIIDWIHPRTQHISIVESDVTAAKRTPELNFRDCGYETLAHRKAVNLVNLSRDMQSLVNVEESLARQNLAIAETLIDADVIINVPVLKTNNLTAVTLGMKNLYGLWGGNKWEFHNNIWDVIDRRTLSINRMIDNIILDLYSIFRPKVKLTVLDGIVGSDGYFGVSWAHPRDANFICAGSDLFSVERVTAELIGVKPEKLAYLRKAEDHGLGSFQDRTILEGASPSEIRCIFDLGIHEALLIQDAIFDGYQYFEMLERLDISEEKIQYILTGLNNFGYISLKGEAIQLKSRLYMNYLLSATALIDHEVE